VLWDFGPKAVAGVLFFRLITVAADAPTKTLMVRSVTVSPHISASSGHHLGGGVHTQHSRQCLVIGDRRWSSDTVLF
jgi:hypothetical protein